MDKRERRSNERDVSVRVGQRLKDVRLMLRMSQTQLADQVGVTFQQIQKYESGASVLAVPRFLAIAEALQADPSFFIQPDPETPPDRAIGARDLREKLGLKVGELARLIGTSHQNVSQREQRDYSALTLDLLFRLAHALDCHPWSLVDPSGVATSDEERALLAKWRGLTVEQRREVLP